MKIAISACILLLLASVFGFEAYQSHLSRDLKRTVAAALDPNASKADVSSYLRESRTLVRTRKDREVERQFERMMALRTENCELEITDSREAAGSGRSSVPANAAVQDCYIKTHTDEEESTRIALHLADLVN